MKEIHEYLDVIVSFLEEGEIKRAGKGLIELCQYQGDIDDLIIISCGQNRNEIELMRIREVGHPQRIKDIATEIRVILRSSNNLNKSEVAYRFAKFSLRNGFFDLAIAYFQYTIDVQDKHIKSYLGYATACYYKGNVDKSREILSKALAIEPNNKIIRYNLSLLD